MLLMVERLKLNEFQDSMQDQYYKVLDHVVCASLELENERRALCQYIK